EHEHGRPDALLAQAAAGLEAVDAREHHVEDDRVIAGRARHPECVLALDRHVGGEAFAAQTAADEARHLDLVFDYQHSHLGDSSAVSLSRIGYGPQPRSCGRGPWGGGLSTELPSAAPSAFPVAMR